MKHRGWVAISGFLWMFVGTSLLYKGLAFIKEAALPQKGALWLIAIGLFLGFVKGRFVLVKTARKTVARIVSLPLPIRLKDVFTSSYLLILSLMMVLAIGIRFLPIDIRGVVDIAVGSALINGALFYFRAALSITEIYS